MRYELKYILTPIQYQLLQASLCAVMDADSHADSNGEYFIRSIYFDTAARDALQEKVNGIYHRKKYRIRFYNGDSEKCTLECKEKTGSRVTKQAAVLERQEAERLLQREYLSLSKRPEPVCRDMYMLANAKILQPVVTVDYVREAFVLPLSNLRVTFDKQLGAGRVENALQQEQLFPNIMGDNVILEVKYDSFLPKHISGIIERIHPVRTSVSKYVMCMEKKLGLGQL